jgi:uncharacterized protein YndB with AHSA1/START domain
MSDELVLTRRFDAPRQLVFEAWTVAEHFRRWFGPDAATVTDVTLDARPGGVIAFRHEFEGGATLFVRGRFDEVVAPERIGFTVGFTDADGRPGRHPLLPDWPQRASIVTTVVLEEDGGRTALTVRQRVIPDDAAGTAAVAAERRAARDGWTEVLDRLSAVLHDLTEKDPRWPT